ncbi:hypothetical protein U1Q18_019353 [Sarracenia purpurea var. burkii]
MAVGFVLDDFLALLFLFRRSTIFGQQRKLVLLVLSFDYFGCGKTEMLFDLNLTMAASTSESHNVVINDDAINVENISYNNATPPSSPPSSVYTTLVPVLLTFLGLKYQGKTSTPFDTHPITMLVIISSFILYCYSTHSKPISRGSVLIGSVCVICLVSVLFENSTCLVLVLYLLYSLVLARELFPQISELWNCLRWRMIMHKIRALIDQCRCFSIGLHRQERPTSSTSRRRPPV